MIIGGISKSIIDTLNFHYEVSVFSKIPKESKWYNWFKSPDKTWTNKYEDGDKSKGEKFLGSTTIFVFTADAWHFFQMIMLSCFQISMAIFIGLGIYLYFNLGIIYFIGISSLSFIVFKLIFSITFEMFWCRIWIK